MLVPVAPPAPQQDLHWTTASLSASFAAFSAARSSIAETIASALLSMTAVVLAALLPDSPAKKWIRQV